MINLKELKQIIGAITKNAEVKKRRNLPIPPILIPVSSPHDIKRLTEYVTDYYESTGLVDFINPESNIIITLNGAVKDHGDNIFYSSPYDDAMFRIQDCAVYQPFEDGISCVIAFNCSTIDNSEQSRIDLDDFLYNLSLIGRTPFLFFVDSASDYSDLQQVIGYQFPNLAVVKKAHRYTYEEIVDIATSTAAEHGIIIEKKALPVLKHIFMDCNITNEKKAREIIRELIVTVPIGNSMLSYEVVESAYRSLINSRGV